jgi:hypothetical protein
MDLHMVKTRAKPVDTLSRKLMSRYGARNRFQEPSLAGRNDNPMPTWFLATIAGLKLPTLDSGDAPPRMEAEYSL